MGLGPSCFRKQGDHESKKQCEDDDAAVSPQDMAIDAVVERLLANDMVNQKYIPDAIERRIYRNMVKLGVGVISESLESVHLDVLNHRISIRVDPLPAQQADVSDNGKNTPMVI